VSELLVESLKDTEVNFDREGLELAELVAPGEAVKVMDSGLDTERVSVARIDLVLVASLDGDSPVLLSEWLGEGVTVGDRAEIERTVDGEVETVIVLETVALTRRGESDSVSLTVRLKVSANVAEVDADRATRLCDFVALAVEVNSDVRVIRDRVPDALGELVIVTDRAGVSDCDFVKELLRDEVCESVALYLSGDSDLDSELEVLRPTLIDAEGVVDGLGLFDTVCRVNVAVFEPLGRDRVCG